MSRDIPSFMRIQHPYAPWMALGRVKGMGRVSFKKLAAHFADPTMAFSATAAELARIEGLDRAAIDGVQSFSAWDEVHEEIRKAEKAGVAIVPFKDSAYPPRLRTIADPPPCLYIKGDWRTDDDRAVAVVGSRSASEYGCRVARDLCRGLAKLGFTVVSGMARGIDAIAHTAALDAGGASVGVLGCGFGVAYPASNRPLYDRMVREGCLLTEFPPGMHPHAGSFPRRNRLISGIGMVTVVVEAGLPSGAITTADRALEQGRTVLAVPGPITSPTSAGCNRLIQQGAKPALSLGDVLEELGLPRPPEEDSVPPRVNLDELTPLQRVLWDALQAEPRHVDALVAATRTDARGVLSALTDLELRGLVSQRPGMVFGLAS